MVLARALRLVADGPLDARTDPRPTRRRRPCGDRLSRRPDRGRRRVRGHRAGRRQPRTAGGPPRRRGDLPAVRRFGAALGRPRRRTAPAAPRWPRRPRTGTSTNWSSTRCARRSIRCVSTCRSPPTPELTSTVGGVAPEHTDHRPAARISRPPHWISRSRCTRPLRSAGCPPPRPPSLIDELEGDRGFYAGAVGWCDAARRRPLGGVHPVRASCRPTAAPPSPTRAAASSPNPTPTTKSTRPQRNSGPSCRRWECST